MELAGSLPPPGWVDSGAEPVTGLDLLGQRLPVQILGNSLLTGVTTITPTVRYLSIHAWLVHGYAQSRGPDRWADFKSFAAAAEAAVVLGNLLVDPGTIGLVGSDRGRDILESGAGPRPLGQLVQQLAVSIYANPAYQLGLAFARDSGIPGLSEERGLPLAECVAARVRGSELGDMISAGKVPAEASREKLQELGELLAIRSAPAEERRLLIQALVPPEPRSEDLPRVETYAALLSLADRLGRAPLESDLFAAAREPERALPPQLNRILDGWLRYSVRDVISTVGECVLQVVVDALGRMSGGGERDVPAEQVLDALLSEEHEHRDVLRSLDLMATEEAIGSVSFADLYERVDARLAEPKSASGGLDRWSGPLHEWSVMDSALGFGPGCLSLLPVAWCLAILRAAPWRTADSGPFEGRSDVGWARQGLEEVIRPTVLRFRQEGISLREATRELAMRTIDQHLRMAWSRMAVDMKRDVSVLASDGSRWRSVGRSVAAGRTASRLPQALGWLHQLGLIEESGITEEGRGVMAEALVSLEEAGS